MASETRRCFQLAYSSVSDRPGLWQTRDGSACMELQAALPASMSYATTVHLYSEDAKRAWDEYPVFKDGDVLILTTRPPLTKVAPGFETHKHYNANDGPLEKTIFNVLKPFIDICTREFLVLQRGVAEKASHEAGLLYTSVKFHQNAPKGSKRPGPRPDTLVFEIAMQVHGRIHNYWNDDGEQQGWKKPADAKGNPVVRALGVFVRQPVAGLPGNPRVELVSAWSWCGLSTLLFCRGIRSRPVFSRWLAEGQHRFALVEMTFHRAPGKRMLTPEFADHDANMTFRVVHAC